MKSPPQDKNQELPSWLWRLEDTDEARTSSRPRAALWGEGQEQERPQDGGRELPTWLRAVAPGSAEGSTPADRGSPGPFSGLPSADFRIRTPAEGVLTWREIRAPQERRDSMGKAFLEFSERIHNSSRRSQVLEVLCRMAHTVVGGFTTILYLRQEGGDAPLLPFRFDGELQCDESLPPLPDTALQRVEGPAILTRKKLDEQRGDELVGLGDLFDSMNASFLALAAIGDEGILAVVERRTDRPLADEDHFFLGSLAHAARDRLAQVR